MTTLMSCCLGSRGGRRSILAVLGRCQAMGGVVRYPLVGVLVGERGDRFFGVAVGDGSHWVVGVLFRRGV